MYLDVFKILVIYQCLMSCFFSMGFSQELGYGEKESLVDCSFLLPLEDNYETPMPSLIQPEAESVIFPPRKGYLNVKHQCFFKLSCKKDHFISVSEDKNSSITVKCLRGQYIEYMGRAYTFSNIRCKAIPWNIKATPRKRTKNSSNYCKVFVSHTDYNLPVPFILSNRTRIIHPNSEGYIHFRKHVDVSLSCTSGNFKLKEASHLSELTIRCKQKNAVYYNGLVYDYHDFKCANIPASKILVTTHKCQKNYSVAAVGFQTQYRYLLLYNICFNREEKIAVYNWYHTTSPHRGNRQTYPERPVFHISKQYYGDIDMDTMYKRQKIAVLKALRSKGLRDHYVNMNNNQFLSRGHLVARTEFFYGFEQQATFYYENVVPLWQIFNKNIWRHVEAYISQRLSTGTSDHMVITGTYGHCVLPDVIKRKQPLFLDHSERLVPVPKFIWKTAIIRHSRSTIVFVGLNNPYAEIDGSIYMCKPTPCPMIVQRIVNQTEGVLYCCTLESFETIYGKIDPIVWQKNLL